MANITFNFDIFYNWYNNYYNNSRIIENIPNIVYFKFEHNGKLSCRLDGFKRLKYLSDTYGNYLNILNKDSIPFKLYNSIFINRMNNSGWLLFVFPRMDNLQLLLIVFIFYYVLR